MAEYPITITLTGDETVMKPALDAFVRNNRWTDQIRSLDENGVPVMIDNPETQTMCARRVIRTFIMNQVQVYNTAQAAKAAADAVKSQLAAALDSTTMTVKAGNG